MHFRLRQPLLRRDRTAHVRHCSMQAPVVPPQEFDAHGAPQGELFLRDDGCFLRLVFDADSERVGDFTHGIAIDGLLIVED